jgi:hypothetical protein
MASLAAAKGKLRVAVNLADFLLLEIEERIEVLDLACELGLELRSVEQGDRCTSTLAFEKVCPSFGN